MSLPPTHAPATTSHVVVLPYPSRGHINPMLNLSKLLLSKNHHILVTFVVTDEWLPSLASEPKPDNLRFGSILDVVPRLGRSADNFLSVVEAVMTEMEAPLEKLLDQLQPPVTFLVYDAFLFWAVGVGNRRNVQVAAFWTTCTSELWVQYFHMFLQNKHLETNGEILIDYIPSTSWVRLADIPLLHVQSRPILQWALKSYEWIRKAQCLLLPSIYELESQVIDALRATLTIPIYTIGPNIPYQCLKVSGKDVASDSSRPTDSPLISPTRGYLDWLDCQPSGSVLYISFGSFLSVSAAQMDEIAAALDDSRVRFLWVTRGEKLVICNNMGMVVAWCDQLRVLLHPAVGGYWTHCGWNSVIEGIFAGVPFLTFPLVMDQPLVSKIIVEDWKVGWRVKKDDKLDAFVGRDEISVLLRKFMDDDDAGSREIRKRANELQRVSREAINEDGSSEINVKALLENIVQSAVTKEGAKRGEEEGEVGI